MVIITPKAAAELLKVSVYFVYQHYESLGGFKLGKLIRFELDQLQSCIRGLSHVSDTVQTGEVESRINQSREEVLPSRVYFKEPRREKRRRNKKQPILPESESFKSFLSEIARIEGKAN